MASIRDKASWLATWPVALEMIPRNHAGQEADAPMATKPRQLPCLPFVPRLPAVLSSTLPSIVRLGQGAGIPDPLHLIGVLYSPLHILSSCCHHKSLDGCLALHTAELAPSANLG